MKIVDTLAKKVLNRATLVYKKQIAANTYHIKMQGESLKNLNYTAGEHLRVFVGMDKDVSLDGKVRTYSVWNYNKTAAEVDLAVCTYTNGPGSSWIRSVAVGEPVYFSGPKGKFIADNTGDYYIMVGDISALAHLYELKRALDPAKPVYGLVYSDKQSDLFPDLDGGMPFNFFEMGSNPCSEIICHLQQPLTDMKTKGKGIVYVGGDANVCVNLNHYFKRDLEWSSKQIKTKPFWSIDKTGLE